MEGESDGKEGWDRFEREDGVAWALLSDYNPDGDNLSINIE
jgi:hypothetical protein